MSTQPKGIVPTWTFGDRIRRIRRLTGKTQPAFARELGYGVKAVGAWESDQNEPADIVAVARHIEDVYGIDAAWTLGLIEGPPRGGPGGGVTLLRARQDSNLQPSDPKVRGQYRGGRAAA